MGRNGLFGAKRAKRGGGGLFWFESVWKEIVSCFMNERMKEGKRGGRKEIGDDNDYD